MQKRFFTIIIILLYASSCFAAVAGNTTDPKVPYGSGISKMKASGLGPFKVGFDYDWIHERNLKGGDDTQNAEIDGSKYIFRIAYTFADRIEPYINVGIINLRTSWDQGGFDIKGKSEHGFLSGIGTKIGLFEIPEHRLRFSMDWHYLYSDAGFDDDSAHVGDPHRNISLAQFKVKEWQIAGLVSMEFLLEYDRKNPAAIASLIPYVGLAYADSDIDVHFVHDNTGVKYDIGNAENKDKILLITGCNLLAPDDIALNVEGRWIGEVSASGGITLKF